MPVNTQLPLPVKLRDQALFRSFYGGPNEELVRNIQELGSSGERIAWIWGEAGTGKTHLLQAACADADNAAYIPLKEFLAAGAQALKGYERYALICLDDIEEVAGNPDWERALFNLYVYLHTEDSGLFLIASTLAPTQIDISLDDLRSRLLSGPVYRLQPLQENELIEAITLRAWERGLKLPNKSAVFLLQHFQRDMPALCALIDRLDTASLVHQRRITIPFINQTILAGDSDGRF